MVAEWRWWWRSRGGDDDDDGGGTGEVVAEQGWRWCQEEVKSFGLYLPQEEAGER